MYVEDRGKLNIMKDYNERTIWTSEQVPLMASYNKGFSTSFFNIYLFVDIGSSWPLVLIIINYCAGKAQHSLWVAEVVNPTADEAMSSSPDVNSMGVQLKQFSFHRIWQGKGAHAAACKVPISSLSFFITNDW